MTGESVITTQRAFPTLCWKFYPEPYHFNVMKWGQFDHMWKKKLYKLDGSTIATCLSSLAVNRCWKWSFTLILNVKIQPTGWWCYRIFTTSFWWWVKKKKYVYYPLNIQIYIITIIISRHQHGYVWPSLTIPPYHPLLPVGLQGYIPYWHRSVLISNNQGVSSWCNG